MISLKVNGKQLQAVVDPSIVLGGWNPVKDERYHQ